MKGRGREWGGGGENGISREGREGGWMGGGGGSEEE